MYDLSSSSQRVESFVSLEVGHDCVEVIGDPNRHVHEILGFLDHVGAPLIGTKAVGSGDTYGIFASDDKIRISGESRIHFRICCKFGIGILTAHCIAKATYKVCEVPSCIKVGCRGAITELIIANRALICACTAHTLLVVQ